MDQYTVTGMSCAACSAKVEKVVSNVSGVEKCTVNLLTNTMTVEGSAIENDIISAVTHAGYGAYKKGEKRIYDLQGRRLNNIIQNGIYIVNGKQILVK